MTPRSAVRHLILFVLAAAPLAQASSQTEQRPTWREPVITFAGTPTDTQRDTIEWAVERYRSAGIRLPDLTISFPQLCSGKAALYHVGQQAIGFCHVAKRTVLHEFAHAWDDTFHTVDRDGFLRLRGLHVWWGGTEQKSAEQGAEQLAQIIAWGLLGANPDSVPQFAGNSVEELTAAFHFLTGFDPDPAWAN
jgi:hypothetical protein